MTICTRGNGFLSLRSKVKIRGRQTIRVRVMVRVIVRVMHRVRITFYRDMGLYYIDCLYRIRGS